jgi:5-hydroxyisourate hydrolase
MITTHVLDISRGRPAAGVPVRLERRDGDGWELIGRGETDEDGRQRTLTPDGASLQPGIYRLTFDTGTYFREQHVETFFPEAAIIFDVRDAAQHFHVPLLLSPFGYSTYRGS